MSTALAIAAYKAEIDGKATGSIDFQVRFFQALDEEQAKLFLLGEEPTCYKNESGELVCWCFERLVAFSEYSDPENGEELVGFITNSSEISTWLK
ncbi:hypothetical protein [Microbulbifer mangrovi]|uniref:hypothetical protein n=1 Tax=Microbulbifer mangrovi TaxID=927787 RepID=UPI0009907D38|nr:hypothetical protein [Microbulbifer mangrovi]